MKVLSVASECVPLVKTGGLADVAGALPGALRGQGVEMRTLLPGYPAVLARLAPDAPVVLEVPELFGGTGRVRAVARPDLPLYVLEAPHLYDRPGSLYLTPEGGDWPDNAERFAALSWVAARIGSGALADWRPDVLHAHDWQGALTPVYVQQMAPGGPRPPTVLSIHNIAFQGIVPMARRAALRLPESGATMDGYEYYGQISVLKAGLVSAERLTTVSPTYARELMRPEHGMGLDGVLRTRAAAFRGILNGIDTALWNPGHDPAIAAPYTGPEGKAANRDALRAEVGLPDAPGPLAVVVSRLTAQKGLDVLMAALPTFLDAGGQLALLGTGAAETEAAWRAAAARMPGLSVRIGYDEAFAHRMIAGADAILVPSRFEPCGLTQLYGLRYGTVPVVALTGGLADTVIPASPAALAAGVATGVQIHPLSEETLRNGLLDLVRLHAEAAVWTQMVQNAMAQPVGWDRAAAEYAALYQEMAAA